MSKSHTIVITLSCENDKKDDLSGAINSIIRSTVDMAINCGLNIDKLTSNSGGDVSNGPVFRDINANIASAVAKQAGKNPF